MESEEKIRAEIKEEIARARNARDLEMLRIKYLGRKGIVSQRLARMKDLPLEKRKDEGKFINELKAKISLLLKAKEGTFLDGEKSEAFFDLSLPGRKMEPGRFHPLSLVIKEVIDIFEGMGFEIVEGPEIETEYYNFEALNTPLEHPARDLQNTFYLERDLLLRTQSSPVQIRIMEKYAPPLSIVSPGKCYRRDSQDATHSPVFHQVEGLMVDKNVNFTHLKGVLTVFLQTFFGREIKVQFRPHFFPFTEPSAEVNVQCYRCKGRGCSFCGSGYLEILGAGMVDPAVFKAVKYDPEVYKGFAFGMGVERLCMLKYGIDDIRLFYENDQRFLRQFYSLEK